MRCARRARRKPVLYGVALAVAASASFEASFARAAPSARLVYLRDPGAETCPDDSAIRSAVALRLGYDPFVAWSPSTLFAEVAKTKDGFTARAKFVDESGMVRGARELTLRTADCSVVIDALALGISIAIDPASIDGPRTPTAPAEKTPIDGDADGASTPMAEDPRAAPPPIETPRVGPPRTEVDATSTKLSPFAFATIAASFGTAPTTAVWGGLFGGLRRGAVSGAVGVRADAPASISVGRGSVGTSAIFGQGMVCGHPSKITVCAALSLGRLSAKAEGVSAPKSDVRLHGMASAQLGYSFEIATGFDLRPHAELGVVLTPHRLELDGVEVFQLSRIVGSVGVSAVVHFGGP